jgi:hypothetical protein
LSIEVWDEVIGGLLGGVPKKGTYLGGIYLEYDAVAELLEQKDFKEHEIKLQVGPPDKKGVPKPIRGGKVGEEATIKITCPGLKYPSWDAVLEERENLINGNLIEEEIVPEGNSLEEGSIEGSLEEGSIEEGSLKEGSVVSAEVASQEADSDEGDVA